MAKRYWLFKSEPSAYSYDMLIADKVAEWDGVRNFQARNFLRDDITEGDGVLFYHSGRESMAVVGIAIVTRSGYPDHTAWDIPSEHFDPRSKPENPLWFMVDIQAVEQFMQPVTLAEMKKIPTLENMILLRRGRLSVQPVSPEEWNAICKLGGVSAF